MRRFSFRTTPIRGLHVIERSAVEDSRGFFTRIFCTRELEELLDGRRIAQINHSHTARAGSIRGMHFQYPPHAEMKLVSCLRGEILDVAVDLREGSPTRLQWHGEILSADNRRSFVIPEGFAHGFQTLSDSCELLYLHTAPYTAEVESGINPLDPDLAIRWPLPITDISARDSQRLQSIASFPGIAL